MKKLIVAVAAMAALYVMADPAETTRVSEVNDTELDEFVAGTGPVEYVSGLSVTNVRNSAFADNRLIRKVVLPYAVDIGQGAFRGCLSLDEVQLPNLSSVAKLQGMFSGCYSLLNVYLGSIDFTEARLMNGFPWQAPNPGIVFHFRNGDYDRNGRKIN